MMTANSFIETIERFLAASGMSASAFGRAALGDPNFVGDVRGGRSPNLRMVERVTVYIAQNSPPAQPQANRDDDQHAHGDGGASATAVQVHASSEVAG